MSEKRAGTRCKVCTYCGACFRDKADSPSAEQAGEDEHKGWSGTRCEVCRGCGKCLREWGLFGADAESGATSWADAFKGMDDGARGSAPSMPAPPGSAAPGAQIADVAEDTPADATSSASVWADDGASAGSSASSGDGASSDSEPNANQAPSTPALAPKRSSSPFATLKSGDDDTDTSTGATPGVSSACKEFGMGNSFEFAASLGIKPPGQA